MMLKKTESELSLLGALKYFLKGNMVFATSGLIIYLIEAPSRIFPALFQKVYTDNIITRKNPEWFTPLLTIYVLLFVLVLTVWITLSVVRRPIRIQKNHKMKVIRGKSSNFVPEINKRIA